MKLLGKLFSVMALCAMAIVSAFAEPPAIVTPDVTTSVATSLNGFYSDITPIIGYVFTAVFFGVTLHFVLRKIRTIGGSA